MPIRGVASGLGHGNAVVLIPQWLPEVETVEVLLFLHGHKWPGYGLGYEKADDESTYRMEQALDQFAASKRPIIAVLPQGGSLSEFGKTPGDQRRRLHPAGDRRGAGGRVAGRDGARRRRRDPLRP